MGNGITSSVESGTTYAFSSLTIVDHAQSIKNLLYGVKWGSGIGSGVTLTYSYGTAASVFNYNSADGAVAYRTELTPTQKTAVVNALGLWGGVANVSFTQVVETASSVGDLRFTATGSTGVATAYAYMLSKWTVPGTYDAGYQAGDMWFGPNYDYNSATPGTYSFHTFIHEMGHTLGLVHPHQPASGSVVAVSGEDQLKYSVMSYRDFYGDTISGYNSSFFPTTPMLNDIAAVQYLYGANMAYNAGNTTYGWSNGQKIYETIWDGGGIDTIDASNQSTGVVISLVSGEWSQIGGTFWNGKANVRDCLTIAYGATIENAIGTVLNDILKGNGANNDLNGGAGDDQLDGGAGDDILRGGLGNDTYTVDSASDVIVEGFGEGEDIVNSTALDYTLSANIETLILKGAASINGRGNGSNNTIIGNAGANVLDGGAGADTLKGGLGNDTYVVDSLSDVIVENLDSGVDTVQSSITYTLAANFENLTLIGTGAINGKGNGVNNVLVGNGAANVLEGFAGNDTLDGSVGDDTLVGGDGNDIYIVDSANDTVVETSTGGSDKVYATVSYTLALYVETLALIGNAAIDGRGNAQKNTIIGNSADNVIDGDLGDDAMRGGAGNDTYYVDSVYDVIVENLNEGIDSICSAAASYTLSANVENLVLIGSARSGNGNASDNILTGNALNNTLNGLTGSDTMIGRGGDDTYTVDNAGDTIVENSAEGYDTVNASVSYTIGANVEKLVLTGTAAINGSGNELDNLLVGNDAGNLLCGYAGNDTLNGGAGNDTMIGGVGDDVYYVNALGDIVIENPVEGIDTVYSSIGYTLGSNLENLVLLGTSALSGTGNALNNTLTGNAANNLLIGGEGDDYLNGGAGDDRMIGGTGNDSYVISSAYDVVVENPGEGNDTIFSAVSLALKENFENLTLLGNTALNGTGNTVDNALNGNVAANVLAGGAGNDALNGGYGNDTLSGGSGNDRYIFDSALSATYNVDKILDFTSGSDTIVLSNSIFGALMVGYVSQNCFNATGLAADADDYLIYSAGTGILSYDADGNGAGLAVKFAVVGATTHPPLGYTDFIVA